MSSTVGTEVEELRWRVRVLERQLAAALGRDSAEPLRDTSSISSPSEHDALLAEVERSVLLGTWVWDLPTNEVRWSPRMFEILGYDPDADEPSTEAFFAVVHQDDVDRMRAVAEDGAASGDIGPTDFRIVRPDGEVRDLLSVGTSVHDEGGHVVRLVGTVVDVTERRGLERQLLHSQKLEAVGRLAGGVAHDFNNVLSAILGNVELIEGRLDPDSPHRSRIERIRVAAERAAGLTHQLLAFSRREIVTPEVVETTALLTELDQLLDHLLGAQIEVRIHAHAGVWPVHADRGQLQQVLMNLAVNARDAMPGGGALRIEAANADLRSGEVARLPAGEYVRFDVTDDGEGIPLETQAHVFDPFFTTKAPGVGTGLGLATCHGIVTQAGGHIGFRSAPGRGTTFTVHLPRAEEETPTASDPGPLTPVPRGRETVLVIEDETFVREMLVEALEDAGYSVLAAADGAEALRLADEHTASIHLLLSDVVLPGMSGPQVADRLRKQRPRMRVLFVTGYPDAQLVRRGALRRGSNVLQKPFTPDAVTRAVSDLLAG